MKKLVLLLGLFLTVSVSFSQSRSSRAEVLYFKAELSCCQAKSCNMLEGTIKDIITKNYTNGKVTFKEVKLSDPANEELIKKHNAGSQTVIIVVTKRKKIKEINATPVIDNYKKDNNLETFEKAFVELINTNM